MDKKLPWSLSQLKSLGKCIRDEIEPPAGLPDYGEVMMHFEDVAVWTQQQVENMDWSGILGDRKPKVTSRSKTIDTLRQKLQRQPDMPLPMIQDVAGVRFVVDMTLNEQTEVARSIALHFGHDPEKCIRDLRVEPHSGYRAVHIFLKLPTKVEIQIRTQLQGAWANLYESAADFIGRGIRYGEMPEDKGLQYVVESLQELSINLVTEVEDVKNEQSTLDSGIESIQELYNSLPRILKPFHRGRVHRTQRDTVRSKERLRGLEERLSASMIEHKADFDSIRTKGKV